MTLFEMLGLEKNEFGGFEQKKIDQIEVIELDDRFLESEIDLTLFKNLKTLILKNTLIQTLDLSQNLELEELIIDNKELNIRLRQEWYESEDQIEIREIRLDSLDLKMNKKLKKLVCCNVITNKLDLSENKLLEYLNCSFNDLEYLIIGNPRQMYHLDFSFNQLKDFNLSCFLELRILEVDLNNILKLSINHLKNLERLSCSGNYLTELDISELSNLQVIIAGENELMDEGLKLPKNNKITFLALNENQLTCFNFSNYPELVNIDLAGNNINIIDISTCDELREVTFYPDPKEVYLKRDQEFLFMHDYCNNSKFIYVD